MVHLRMIYLYVHLSNHTIFWFSTATSSKKQSTIRRFSRNLHPPYPPWLRNFPMEVFTAETWHLDASKSGNVATGSSWDSGIMVLAPEAKTCNQGWIWLKCCLRWFNPNLPTIVKHVFFKQSSNILFKMVQDCWSDCWKMVQDVSRGFETVLDGLGWFKAISMYLRNQQLWYVNMYRG